MAVTINFFCQLDARPMTAKEIAKQLEHITPTDDFAWLSSELAKTWASSNVGIEAIEPILHFMERNPSIEYGMPGALVHFIERFYGNGYEDKLIEAINRKPTAHTILMLNRLINGTKDFNAKHFFIMTMKQARMNPLADKKTIESVNELLEGHL